MSVLILSTSSFPWGMAATTRVRCLAKGMIAEGIDVKHIGLHGADVDYSPDKKSSGMADGIKYSYPGGFAVRSRYWLVRRADDFLGWSATLATLCLMKVQRKLDAVLIYSRHHNTVSFLTWFLHIMKVPVILELCEWPLAIADTRKTGFKEARAFCNDSVLLVDGVIPISTYIDCEVRNITEQAGKHIPSFRIPILIDVEDTDCAGGKSQEPYLLYTGAISYSDIAKLVVDISARLREKGIEIKIKFTGGGSRNLFEALEVYAESKGVLDNFEFTGFVSDEKLARLMCNATALLAPLPENLQSISRFPTKLGYYLASGSPVVTNAVGDVKLYLQDGVNAAVAEKCDAALIAEKVENILADTESAQLISSNGKRFAFDTFHYRQATKGIRNFFESFCSNQGR